MCALDLNGRKIAVSWSDFFIIGFIKHAKLAWKFVWLRWNAVFKTDVVIEIIDPKSFSWNPIFNFVIFHVSAQKQNVSRLWSILSIAKLNSLSFAYKNYFNIFLRIIEFIQQGLLAYSLHQVYTLHLITSFGVLNAYPA